MPAQDDVTTPFAANEAGYSAVEKVKAKMSSGKTAAIPAVCFCILIVELCERLAFYTFTGTQEFFLEKLGYSVASAGGINAAMGTLCMAWAIFAGWVADIFLGRYYTILVFGMCYVTGSVLAMSSAYPDHQSSKWYLVGIMGLVPIGTAGIKANISNFGADQYDVNDPAQVRAREKFFSWFYMAINLGSAVAYGGLTTIGASGGLGVPKKYGYFFVYAIAAAAMQLAVLLFRSGRAAYKIRPTQSKSSLAGVAEQIRAAAKAGSWSASAVYFGFIIMAVGLILSVVQALAPATSWISESMGVAAFCCSAVGISLVVCLCLDPDWLLQGHVYENNTLSPADVRDFLRLMPVLFMANLAFSALYNSMQFWYQQQACQMDTRMPWGKTNDAQFAGSFFMIADCIGIVIATPVALYYADPAMDRLLGRPLGPGAKYMIGMTFGGISVLIAARVEMLRRIAPVIDVQSNCAPDGINMSEMQASWMFVPFFLMGLGEIYTQPTLMHLAYDQSPPSMRTLTAATSLVIGGVSTALFSLQISALSNYIPNDLNKGQLEIGYASNVVLGVIFLFGYLACLNRFQEKNYDHEA
jgi:dipeptide/tripeptide permease